MRLRAWFATYFPADRAVLTPKLYLLEVLILGGYKEHIYKFDKHGSSHKEVHNKVTTIAGWQLSLFLSCEHGH